MPAPLLSMNGASAAFTASIRGTGRSSKNAASNKARLPQTASARKLKNPRISDCPALTHSPASSPSRILAFISTASLVHEISGGSIIAGTVAHNSENSATSCLHAAHDATCRSTRHRCQVPKSPPANSASTVSFGCFVMSAFPPGHIPAQFDARIGNVRTHRGFRTIQPQRDFFRRASFHIPQHQRGSLPRRQQAQTVLQVIAMLLPQQQIFRRFLLALVVVIDLAKCGSSLAPLEIDGGVGGGSR